MPIHLTVLECTQPNINLLAVIRQSAYKEPHLATKLKKTEFIFHTTIYYFSIKINLKYILILYFITKICTFGKKDFILRPLLPEQ